MKHPLSVLSCLFLIFLAVTPVSAGGKIYKWVDEKGVIHFSDRAPDSPESVKGSLEERDLIDPSPDPKDDATDSKLSGRTPIEHAVNCTFTIRGAKRVGTGFLIASNGYAVTCKHVVEEPSTYTALLNDQTEYPLNIISVSQRYDLAIVQVSATRKMSYMSLRDARSLIPGDRLFAIGASAGLNATVTDGVFTSFRQLPQKEEEMIQFSAPVNPGNSGGPLVDDKAQVIGVVRMKFESQKGVPISGVGFAIPSSHLLEEYSIYFEQR